MGDDILDHPFMRVNVLELRVHLAFHLAHYTDQPLTISVTMAIVNEFNNLSYTTMATVTDRLADKKYLQRAGRVSNHFGIKGHPSSAKIYKIVELWPLEKVNALWAHTHKQGAHNGRGKTPKPKTLSLLSE